jgi:hypothetical protein
MVKPKLGHAFAEELGVRLQLVSQLGGGGKQFEHL